MHQRATTAEAPPRPQPQGRPRMVVSQEMRFAIVMYGGTSLAIYINGVAQELLALVRATAADLRASPDQALLPTTSSAVRSAYTGSSDSSSRGTTSTSSRIPSPSTRSRSGRASSSTSSPARRPAG